VSRLDDWIHVARFVTFGWPPSRLRLGRELGLQPGAELEAAYQESWRIWRELRGPFFPVPTFEHGGVRF
jgi:hypothetical protein